MFRLLSRILQTVNTNSRHGKQLFENVFNFVSITAGRNKSSQDNMSSCIPAVIVPPQQTDSTNRASPVRMTQSQVNAATGILKRTQAIRMHQEEQLSKCRKHQGDLSTVQPF